MQIRKLVNVGAALLVLVMTLGGLLAATRINEVRIGGPIQVQMQEASDLVADILPPPQYIIEPFLEVTELRNRPYELDIRGPRLEKLRAQYEERHAYWQKSRIDPALRAAITEGSHKGAELFWAELDRSFLPAVRANDRPRIEASYLRLEDYYQQHRAKVNEAVDMAATYQTALKSHSETQLNWAIGTLVGLALLVLGLVIGASLALRRKVIQPLVEVVDATSRLADGQPAIVPHRDRKDELGQMAGAVELFRIAAESRAEADARNAREQELVTTTLGRSLEALQRGDLTFFLREEFPDAYASLKLNYNKALDALRSMVQQVSESATEISLGAGEIAAAAEELSRRTEGNAASLEQTNAAVAQVEQLIRSTSDASLRTVSRADQARSTVETGRSIADGAVQAMGRVNDSAQGIDAVIEAMDKIAFQTRVLAMNAAVEAGRAGEAGRGFSVVADLVTALAMRAEEEAKRARDQLTVTQAEIVTAVDAVKGVDGALANITSDVEEVHVLLGSIATDNQAQARAVGEIAVALGDMDKSTQLNASMVERTSVATRGLSGEVSQLAERASAFKFDRRVRDVPVAFDRRKPKADRSSAVRFDLQSGTGPAEPAPATRPATTWPQDASVMTQFH